MHNYLNLAKNLRSNTLPKALSIYRNDVICEAESLPKMKKYLYNLNTFLYTYFLVQFNKDLLTFANKTQALIEKEENIHLLAEIGEKLIVGYTNKFASVLKENDHELIEHALEYINKNYHKKLTLQMVANRLHISRNYLCHLFKIQTGYKFCEYINLQRVNKAKKLIEEDKKTFEFISFDCGFSSQSHFSTTFKKYVGLTPNEYKKQIA